MVGAVVVSKHERRKRRLQLFLSVSATDTVDAVPRIRRKTYSSRFHLEKNHP